MSLVGILGLARSGIAAARLALARGERVYASDAGDTPALRAAAEEIRALGGAVDVGGHSLERLAECDVLVVSPGIPPTAAFLRDPALAHVPRISELEFAWRHLDAPVIAITGTNGKSTTTALAAHLLQAAGRSAPAAGNIGRALSDVAIGERPDWVVVEASSFQLADIDTFAPAIGVVTNLSPDHLDRYESVDAYYADKAMIFRNASAASTWVLNAEDDAVLALAADAPGTRRFFRTDRALAAGQEGAFLGEAGELTVRRQGRDESLVNVAELKLLGRHNHANALAAAVAAVEAGADTASVANGLRTFGGLEHRLEPVLERDGVLWINDSKATNIGSTRVALASMTRPTVLLLGGRHKGESYTLLLNEIGTHVKAVIAYGEAAPTIDADLASHVAVECVGGSFEDVMAKARAIARTGDAVLLSPACSSFDMFRDYEERGRRFKALVVGEEVRRG